MAKKQAMNPYLPSWEYIPDGEPYVFGDRVYVYGSHDQFNGWVFCQGDYVCWSAPIDDLGNWRYEGVIYPRNEDPANKEGKACLYAPDVTVGPDGRYYLYYVLDKVDFVSVAVCDTPAGRYQFYGYVHYPDGRILGSASGDMPQFDPGVITEGDTTYLYTGFCGIGDKSRLGAMVTVLEKDMLTIKEGPKVVVPGSQYSQGTCFEKHAFFEASSIRKIGDTYYFIYSSEVMHELCYATSKSPLGPFEYGGVIVSNKDLGIDTYKPSDLAVATGGNNHGSIVQIGEKWYIFYHRHTNGTWFSRQGCAEEIKVLPDGSIPQVEMTSCGLNGGPLEAKGEYPACYACHLFSERGNFSTMISQEGKDGDETDGYIVNLSPDTVIGFKYFDFKGVKKITVRVRGYFHGKFEVKTSLDGEVLAEIPCYGSNVWEAHSVEVDIPDGIKPLYLVCRGGGGQLKSIEFN